MKMALNVKCSIANGRAEMNVPQVFEIVVGDPSERSLMQINGVTRRQRGATANIPHFHGKINIGYFESCTYQIALIRYLRWR
eukprot:SAG11_NODE_775_length_7226_cov_2.988214_8_plen_82_part_00